jgi:glutamate synthase domain-containing protein 3
MLYAIINSHVEATASSRGKWVLENWENMLPKFVKVFPHEYKRVLGVGRLQVAVA